MLHLIRMGSAQHFSNEIIPPPRDEKLQAGNHGKCLDEPGPLDLKIQSSWRLHMVGACRGKCRVTGTAAADAGEGEGLVFWPALAGFVTCGLPALGAPPPPVSQSDADYRRQNPQLHSGKSVTREFLTKHIQLRQTVYPVATTPIRLERPRTYHVLYFSYRADCTIRIMPGRRTATLRLSALRSRRRRWFGRHWCSRGFRRSSLCGERLGLNGSRSICADLVAGGLAVAVSAGFACFDFVCDEAIVMHTR